MAGYKRRSHPRVSTQISVRLKTDDGRTAQTEEIRNISLGGVFIQMQDPFAFGTELTLEFSLPVAPKIIRCKGFVVWSTKTQPERGGGLDGIGVRLMDIGINDMRHLADYVEKELSV